MNVSTLNYKPLRHVLNYVPVSYRREEDDVDQWKSWALQCLRKVNMHQRYVYDVALIDINNHKGQLPAGIKKISSIKVLYRDPTDGELASLNSCIAYDSYKDVLEDTDPTTCETGEKTTTTTTVTETLPGGAEQTTINEKSVYSPSQQCCSLNVKLFVQSEYYNNCFKPMRFIGTTGADYFTKTCFDVVHDQYRRNDYWEFSLSEDGCLLTEFKTGSVCIEYTRELKDNDEFLAPDHPEQLWSAMAHYGMAHYWLNRTGYKEQGAMSMYKEHLAISSNYLREAKGIFKLKSIDFATHLAITYNESAALKTPSVWTNKIGFNDKTGIYQKVRS